MSNRNFGHGEPRTGVGSRRVFALFVFGMCLMLAPWTAGAPAVTSPRLTPIVLAVRRVMPSVVNIRTQRLVQVSDPFALFFNDYFGRHMPPVRVEESSSLGSGVIVCCSGLVVTNYHIIKRGAQIEVHLWDGRNCTAEMVACDVANDLALLRLAGDLDKPPLPAIEFALPNDLYLGETVVAVGNPFGLEHTVTAGVLSSTDRSYHENGVTFNDILQTSAAINPGNSGGPLINLDGRLIGLNLAIHRAAEGISFAIPMRRIEDVLARWLVPSRFSLAFCGFVPQTRMEDGKAAVAIAEIVPDSPAAAAGIAANDILTHFNGAAVTRAIDVGRRLWHLAPGDKAVLTLAGKGERTVEIGIMAPAMLIRRRLGIQVQELTKPLLRALELPEDWRGLTISQVLPESDFAALKVRRGDIIVQLGNTKTETIEDMFNVLKDLQYGDSIPIVLVAIDRFQGRLVPRHFQLEITLMN